MYADLESQGCLLTTVLDNKLASIVFLRQVQLNSNLLALTLICQPEICFPNIASNIGNPHRSVMMPIASMTGVKLPKTL